MESAGIKKNIFIVVENSLVTTDRNILDILSHLLQQLYKRSIVITPFLLQMRILMLIKVL